MKEKSGKTEAMASDGTTADCSTQFETTSRKHLEKDAEWWETQFRALFAFYTLSEMKNETDREMRAFHCSRIAGLALALADHMALGTRVLLYSDDYDNASVQACAEAAARQITIGQNHTKAMEDKVCKSVS